MRKLLVLSAILLVVVATSSASSANERNWTEDFESYAPGPLNGQGPWVAANPATSPIVADTPPLLGGSQVARQVNLGSFASADLRDNTGMTYGRGHASFRVYDPGDVTGSTTAAQVGLFSSGGTANAGYMFSAGLNTSSSRNYWNMRYGYSAVNADGVSAPSGTGYSFTPGIPAPRVSSSWNSVLITWNFEYSPGGGSGIVQWYVNQTSTPNLTLNLSSNSIRWLLCHNVAGVYIGNTVFNQNPATFDNIEFHGAPEPSGLLILGGGMLGMLGLIRRRR